MTSFFELSNRAVDADIKHAADNCSRSSPCLEFALRGECDHVTDWEPITVRMHRSELPDFEPAEERIR
jgi:hypothetical protein